MKLLKSKFNGGKWDDIEVVPLAIDNLWASVPKADKLRNRPFYKPVMEDIKANGLHFPLLIVEATRRQVREQKDKYKRKMCELPFDGLKDDLNEKMYVVWGGSNRVRAAEELGFTHIDCVIFRDGQFQEAMSRQKLHRRPYQKKFY